MTTHFVDLDVAAASLTGFASNVTGAAFTITTNATTDGLAHRVSIRNDSANNHSGKTVALVGTDADDRTQSETVTGPAGSATVESTKYFKTLTSATPSATIGADTFDIGWVDEIASRTIFLNRYAHVPPSVQLNITGTLELSVEITNSPREHFALDSEWPVVWVNSRNNSLVLATASSIGAQELERNVTACRVVFDSYSSGAEAQVYIGEHS